MTEKKLDYLSPETEALIVKFEGVICYSQNGDTQTEYYQSIDGGDL